MSTVVDISGLDKVKLLKAMYAYAFESPFSMSPGWTDAYDADAQFAIERGHIDYFKGRAIKSDLSKDTVDSYLYDRDAGQGRLLKIVARLRTE